MDLDDLHMGGNSPWIFHKDHLVLWQCQACLLGMEPIVETDAENSDRMDGG